MAFIEIMLALSALYCACMYAFLGFLTFRDRVNYENETFHLGLCFILAIGFLGLIMIQGS